MSGRLESGWNRETLRILAAVVLPGAALLLVSGSLALEHWRSMREMRHIEASAGVISQIGAAIHELQVERGLSALRLSPAKAVPATRLQSQRERCDVEIRKLHASLATFDFGLHPDATAAHEKAALLGLSGLEDLRRSVDTEQIPPERAIESYSGFIEDLLRVGDEMVSTAADSRAPRELAAYPDLLEAKEEAGQERAWGGVWFAAGGLTEANRRRLTSLIDAQGFHLHRFSYAISREQRALLQEQLGGEDARKLEELRRIALASARAPGSRQIDPIAWFDVSTRRIVGFKALENRLSADLVEGTSRVAGAARDRLAIFFIGAMALAAALVWIVRGELREHWLSRENLAETSAQFNEITERAPDAIVTIDRHGAIRFWNRAAEYMFGYPASEALGQNIRLIVPERFRAAHEAALAKSTEAGVHPVTRRLDVAALTQSGEEIEVDLSLTSWATARGPVYAAIIRDVSEQRRAEAQIRSLAYYDMLTGLPNRELFRDKLEDAFGSAKREGRPMALLFLDLDGFKRVNDSLGHSMGDRLLAMAAERLLTSVRINDCVARCEREDPSVSLARLGGDEFTILLTHLSDHQNAALVAQRILEVLREPFEIEGTEVVTTASIGVAVYPADGGDAETLLKNADAAMYSAKENGRDQYRFFSESMSFAATRKLDLAVRLRQALERGEFSLCYQPLRDAVSSKMTGAEALLRWVTPNLGSVPPDEFIPIAEETGLIVAIGAWVLRTACAQARTWQDAGFAPICVAVNLSGQQLRDSSFVETVTDALEQTRLSPAFLEFEITESSIMQNDGVADVILRELHELGITLVLDDFGTGYSSLSYLRRFPIDRVKIDRSFVAQLPDDPEDRALASAIIAMARSLRLTVVAEGVETLPQAEFLRELGCDVLQGYLFSPPVPASDFARFLEVQKPA